jgi:23S rRNA (cytidine1920-2'-O)/16S rRNA (cytidine1409-2'-O)-methyltransferase
MKIRLDQALVARGLVATRSQAASYIELEKVKVGGRVITKPGFFVGAETEVELTQDEQFVSRAALKLKSVAEKLNLDFKDKTVLDVGSSTGGFTDFSLRRGAKKVVAVDVGTEQLHLKLRANPRVELHEKTDIRSVIASTAKQSMDDCHVANAPRNDGQVKIETPDIILIDVSFISIREILSHLAKNVAGKDTIIVAMVKPQFETGAKLKNAGVIKNDTERRKILHDFETWVRKYFLIKDKKDSEVAGTNGNRERFYLLKPIS